MADKVNYDRIAPHYDRFRRAKGPYSDLLWKLASAHAGEDFLELGPGTGNETAAMRDAVPCRITGLERSWGMCTQAKAKGTAARWVQGHAEHLPFAPQRFAFVFGAYMLHYLPDLRQVFRECRRVLRPGGSAAFVTVSHAFIRSHPMNRWFPSITEVDTERFPDIPVVEAALRDAGFIQVQAEDSLDPPKPIDDTYAEKVSSRFISTYDLLPPDEFTEGLVKLRRDIAAGKAGTIAREATVVWGRVPEA